MKNILKYIIEAIIVSFGVFLGIFVSDWNTQRKIDENVKSTMDFILVELDNNISEFDKAAKYHDKLKIEFDSITKGLSQEDMMSNYYQTKKFIFQQMPNWKGLQTAITSRIAYESGKINGTFQELNINTIQTLSKGYKYIELYDKAAEIPIKQFLTINSDSKVIDIQSILDFLLGDILINEKQIKTKLEKIRDKLQTIVNNNNYKR